MVNYEHDPILEAYFRDVRQHDMISDSSQRELASEIQSRLAKIDQYEQKLDNSRVKPHTKAKIREKLPILRDGIRDLQARLTEVNLRFVVHRAKKQNNRGLEYLDLIQEGNIQMFDKAATMYNPNDPSSSKFTSYASWWIWQGMNRAIADQSRTVRVSSGIHEKINKIKTFSDGFFTENGRLPYPEEISKSTGIPLDKVELALEHSKTTYSLDKPVGDDNDTTLADTLPYENDSPEERGNKYRQDVENLLDNTNLTQRERKVLDLRFGLSSGCPITLEESGKQYGLTRERVRQIEEKAIKKLKKTTKRLNLKLEDIL